MGRVLLLDGTASLDGLPLVEPAGAWLPAWSGGTRAHPGQAVSYASERPSGIQRRRQLPHSQYAGLPQPARDLAEYDHPLREVGPSGILLERSWVQLLESGDWDISTWASTNTSAVTAGVRGPTGETTGEGQAYRFTSTANGGFRELAEVVAVNLNATTYVFAVWVRRSTAGTVSIGITSGGVEDFTVEANKWTRVTCQSRSVNTTTTGLRIYPGGQAGQATCEVWGPTLVDTGASANNQARGRSSTISPAGTLISSKLSGAFAWPSAPWTFYARFQPFWGATDSLGHSVFGAYVTAGTSVIRLTKTSANILQVAVRTVRGGSSVATVTPAGASFDEAVPVVWHVVGRLSRRGALEAWLNGVAFTTQVAAPGALIDQAPSQLDVGDDTTGLGALDGLLRRFEVWDEIVEPRRFF